MCAIPALRAMRSAWPGARMTLVGLPWARSFVERFSCYLDDFLEFPGFDGLPERAPDETRLASFRAQAELSRFDLALQLHGDGRITNRFLPLIAARFQAGFYADGDPCPDPARFVLYTESEPETLRLLALTDYLGLPRQGLYLDFPLFERDRREARLIQEAEKLVTGTYVCVHPGARDGKRRWPVEHFAQIAQLLSARCVKVVVTGTREESGLAAMICEATGDAAVNLAGRTSLGGLAALLAEARLLVSNDTGLSHLAAALEVPSVIVFSGSDPARWAPLDRRLLRAVGNPTADAPRSATPDDVCREIDELLGGNLEKIKVRNGGA